MSAECFCNTWVVLSYAKLFFSKDNIGIRKAKWGSGKVHLCMAGPWIKFHYFCKTQEIHDKHADSAEEHAKNPNMGKHKFSNEEHKEHLASLEDHQRHSTSDEEHQNLLRSGSNKASKGRCFQCWRFYQVTALLLCTSLPFIFWKKPLHQRCSNFNNFMTFRKVKMYARAYKLLM